ncbi:hypothetical protein HY643_00710 [Candidatus Woesearchaeota archaeon]|nr:hypothetical protein [Candidatus Woesearchaeota archaeon]
MEEEADQQLKLEIKKLAKAGLKIKDEAGLINWFKDKINKGFQLSYITKKLESYNYDFETVDRFLEDIYAKNVKTEQAYTKIVGIENKFKKEEKEKKQTSEVVRIFSAFLICGVAAFTAVTIGKQAESLAVDEEGMEGFAMIGDFIKTFVTAAWAITIIAGIIGLTFLALFLYKYVYKPWHLKKQAQKQNQAQPQTGLGREEKQSLEKNQQETNTKKEIKPITQEKK